MSNIIFNANLLSEHYSVVRIFKYSLYTFTYTSPFTLQSANNGTYCKVAEYSGRYGSIHSKHLQSLSHEITSYELLTFSLYVCFFIALDPSKDPCLKVKCSPHKVCVTHDYETATCVSRKQLVHR